MPLIKSGSKEAVSENIREFRTGPTYAGTAAKFGKKKANQQAIAVALNVARRAKRQEGGAVMSASSGIDEAAEAIAARAAASARLRGRRPINDIPERAYMGPSSLGAQSVLDEPTPGGLFNLAQTAYRGLRGAGRAVSGGYNTEPEVPGQWSEADEFRAQNARQTMRSDASDLGGALMTGTMPLRGPAGSVGTFLKPNNPARLERAQDMAASGRIPGAIWGETGLFQGGDQQWRRELSDVGAHVTARGRDTLQKEDSGQLLPDLLRHERLYQEEPWLRDVVVRSVPGNYGATSRGMRIDVNPKVPGYRFEDPAREMLIHELDHEISRPSGFMVGRGPRNVGDIKYIQQEFNYFADAQTVLDEAKRIAGVRKIPDLAYLPSDAWQNVLSRASEDFKSVFGRNPETGGAISELRSAPGRERLNAINWIDERYNKYLEQVRRHPEEKKKAYEDYWNQASEVSARNAAHRRNMTEEQRRLFPPYTTEDVPRNLQSVDMLVNREGIGGGIYKRLKPQMASGGAVRKAMHTVHRMARQKRSS